MDFLDLYALAALTVLCIVTVLWAVSVAVRDASIIDVFWGSLFVAIAWILLAFSGVGTAGKVLPLVFMVTAWGLRLSFHLGARNFGEGEDRRYALWRAHGGPRWWIKTYYRIYLLQGAIALVVATPIVAVFYEPDFRIFNAVGVALWLVGTGIESIADVQLARFRGTPGTTDRVLSTGLWRYSRHPNYFGDALQWWGLALFALTPSTWWSPVGALAMTLVFAYVSTGVIERGLKKRRPDYARYADATSGLVPFLPQPGAGTHDEPRTMDGRPSTTGRTD